jgi:Zn-dependent metalloprotease
MNWARRLRRAAVLLASAGAAFVLAPPAVGQRAACTVRINQQPVSAYPRSQPLEVDSDAELMLDVRAVKEIGPVRVDAVFPPQLLVLERRIDGPSFTRQLPVAKIDRLGVVGLQVEVANGECRETAWVKINAPPIRDGCATAAAGAGAAAGGVVLVALGLALRGKRGAFIGILGAGLAGLGGVVLAEEYGTVEITPAVLAASTVLPAAAAGMLHRLIRRAPDGPPKSPTQPRWVDPRAKTMVGEFKRVRVHTALQAAPLPQPDFRGFHTPEAAARFYLSHALQAEGGPALRGVAAPDRPELVPGLTLVDQREEARTETRLVRFKQTHQAIPVFGSKAVVEVDRDGALVSLDAELADMGDISPTASISPSAALQAVAARAGTTAGTLLGVPGPELRFYLHEAAGAQEHGAGEWHLAWFLVDVPAAPPGFFDAARGQPGAGHGPGPSPRRLFPRLNYVVDAHSGEILSAYSAAPTVDAPPSPRRGPLEVPSECKGYGDDGVHYEFMGSSVDDGYDLRDPTRDAVTYSLGFGSIGVGDDPAPLPARPVTNLASDYQRTQPGAVSAHVNATRVFDFYNGVLQRDGVDDKHMDLISVVNCANPDPQGAATQEWPQAVWWANRMWYGQTRNDQGKLVSWSVHLDVMAHELTHGVTAHTANLMYRDESGALDESLSDIFGIIISNWYTAPDREDVSTWSWEMGSGLGPDGRPLRDLSDPRRTGHPDHMQDFVKTRYDSGGVHANSNIHNKAAYNVLTARTASGAPAFSVTEVACLYYWALTRLSETATFTQMLEALIDVAATYFRGDPTEMNDKIAQLRAAYAAVGIEATD